MRTGSETTCLSKPNMHIAHARKDETSSFFAYQTCAEHSRAVASLAGSFLAKQGLSASGYLAGLLHDCGKFSDSFDQYLLKAVHGENVRKGSIIHTFTGVRYLLTVFHRNDSALTLDDLAAEIIALGIGSHHGLIDIWNERHECGFTHRLAKQPVYDQQAICAFQSECANADEVSALYAKAREEILDFYRNKVCSCVNGPEEGYFALGMLVRLLTSAVVAGDRTDTACFMQNLPHPNKKEPAWNDCWQHIETYLDSFFCDSAVQRARRTFSDLCSTAAKNPPGLYRLDLPTGGGKTLSALRFAVRHAQLHGMKRIYYIAPLLSILEQNAGVIRKAVGETVQVLEHHSNVVRDGTSDEEANRSELLQETWDVPVVITTLVQMLDTMFSGKMSAVRRFHCLCNSVIIIDELQSLPRKMLTIFNCAINFLTKCCGTTIVLCSATQPALDHKSVAHRLLPCQRLISKEIYEQYAPLFQRTEIMDGGSISMDELIEVSKKLMDGAESLLIVCNTKREAADIYRSLRDMPDVQVYHLSAGMCAAHRRQILDQLTNALQEHQRLVCVATQVIEAGIDVSFQKIIRLSAGLDNIIQAAGRCNRHGESHTPRPVIVYRLLGEKLGSLREIKDTQDALNALLAEYKRAPERYDYDLTSDAAVRCYYAFLYGEMPKNAQDYPSHDHTLFELLSTNPQWVDEPNNHYLMKQAFRTAGDWFKVFEDTSESVLVPYEKGRKLIDLLKSEQARTDLSYAASILAEAKQYTVSLPASRIERMVKRGTVYSILEDSVYAINEEYYNNEIGVKEESDPCGTPIL